MAWGGLPQGLGPGGGPRWLGQASIPGPPEANTQQGLGAALHPPQSRITASTEP